MPAYTVAREWRAGLRLDIESLNSIDRSIRAVIQGGVLSTSLSLELSNSTSLNGHSLDDLVSEPNLPGRLFEVLTLDYRNYGRQAVDDQSESVQLTFSRRESQPAAAVRITAPSRERLALVAREVESRVEGVIVERSLLVSLLTPPNRNDLAPLTQLAMLIPIATMIWTGWSISRELAGSKLAFEGSIAPGASAAEVGRALAEFMTERSTSTARQQLVVMLSLALLVCIWVVTSQMSVASDVALNRHFLIGDYAKKYHESLGLRTKLLWSGGVGLLVSLLGSALIYFVTK